jgi:hypothetical protein
VEKGLCSDILIIALIATVRDWLLEASAMGWCGEYKRVQAGEGIMSTDF